MNFDRMFSSLNIAASALNAERARMNVVASNLAKANVTAKPGETPPQREMIFFKEVFERAMSGAAGDRMAGVEIAGIMPSNEEPRYVADPGHPNANEEGFVAYPNISVSEEMVNLISASRSYGANLAVMKSFKEMMIKTLAIGQ